MMLAAHLNPSRGLSYCTLSVPFLLSLFFPFLYSCNGVDGRDQVTHCHCLIAAVKPAFSELRLAVGWLKPYRECVEFKVQFAA